jgi:hypothetical protein
MLSFLPMKRRVFLALPALAPLPAAAFRAEAPEAALVADLEDSCAAAEGAHEEIRALLDRAAAGAPLPADRLRALGTCPFCRCQVAWVPPADQTR